MRGTRAVACLTVMVGVVSGVAGGCAGGGGGGAFAGAVAPAGAWRGVQVGGAGGSGGGWGAAHLPGASVAALGPASAGAEYGRRDGSLSARPAAPMLATAAWPEPPRASLTRQRTIWIETSARVGTFYVPEERSERGWGVWWR